MSSGPGRRRRRLTQGARREPRPRGWTGGGGRCRIGSIGWLDASLKISPFIGLFVATATLNATILIPLFLPLREDIADMRVVRFKHGKRLARIEASQARLQSALSTPSPLLSDALSLCSASRSLPLDPVQSCLLTLCATR